eukprot:6208060-Pleurochrysis_carterae.AAC.5
MRRPGSEGLGACDRAEQGRLPGRHHPPSAAAAAWRFVVSSPRPRRPPCRPAAAYPTPSLLLGSDGGRKRNPRCTKAPVHRSYLSYIISHHNIYKCWWRRSSGRSVGGLDWTPAIQPDPLKLIAHA